MIWEILKQFFYGLEGRGKGFENPIDKLKYIHTVDFDPKSCIATKFFLFIYLLTISVKSVYAEEVFQI